MNAPWLEHYDPGVPKSIGTYPNKTLVDYVAEASPDKTAVVFKGRKITFGEIDRASDALAHSLKAIGVKEGDRVALMLPNSPHFVIAEMAVWKLGAMIAPQSLLYTDRELQDSLNASAPETAVVLTPFYDKLKNIQAQTSIRRVIATNIKEYLPGVLRVLFTLVKEKKEGHRITLREGDSWMQSLIEEGRSGGLQPAGGRKSAATPDMPAVVLMSGGTTGTPKGVVSEHRSLIQAGTQLTAWLKEALQGPDASIMLPLPLFHTYGCSGVQSLALMNAIPLILVPSPRDLDDVVKTIQRDKPALFCGVPTLFNALLNHREVIAGKVDFRSIRACFSGAAALLAETKKRFEELTGGRIVEGYSLSEATMACFVNPYRGANKIGSVGMPVSDVFARIVDGDDATKELATGEVGEVLIHAPQLMRGYWNNPAETANMLRTAPDGKQWLYTGDLGYLDEDGYLFLVDRKKDLIKTSGYQVWPREIEEVIAAHPAVAEVGVAGLPDARKGEAITAWIVPRPGETIDTDELRAFCKEKLAPYKVPSNFEMRTELPKTMVGKVLRRVLVAEAKAKAGA
ncbi:MAG TPA: AMP-binding protein [Thermoanaerobaculia bacterium]|nr:AMP-binding protein [Thermoanaerobaculia bacterium]